MDQRLNGLHSLSYMGVNSVQPPNLTERTFDPTPADSKNFQLGDLWLNTDTDGLWVLVDLSGNVALWEQFAFAGSISSFSTFHTDNGDAVVVADAITFNAVSQAGATVTFSGSGSTVRLNVTSVGFDTIIGLNAGNNTFTATNCTSLGYNTLHALTTGVGNTAVGFNAGSSITTGSQNVIVGNNAGIAITTAGQNTLVGRFSGIALTTGGTNVAIGSLALGAAITGTNNTCVGQGAGFTYNTSESNNIVIGAFNNGLLTESGVTRVGSYSGTSNNFNTFIGFLSGNNTYTIGSAIHNTATGNLTLRALTTGLQNTAQGSRSLTALTTGSGNTSVGYNSLSSITTGSNNTTVGTGAGSAYTTADEGNIVIGVNSGLVGETGTIRIGNSGIASTTANIFIGLGCGNTSYTLASADNNNAIGTSALAALTTGEGNVCFGSNTLASVSTGSNNTSIGAQSLTVITTGSENIAMGLNAGSNYATSDSTNIIIGKNPGKAGENGILRVGNEIITGNNANTFVGNGCGNITYTLSVTDGINNTAMGAAAYDAFTTGFNNTAIGHIALTEITSGANNTGLGNSALSTETTGDNNTAIGSQCMANHVGGSNNTAFGFNAGSSVGFSGSTNIFIGMNSANGYNGAESDNLLIGNVGTTGESNVIRIGTQGGGSGQQNKAFMAGISGVTTGGAAVAVLVDASGQLGTVSSSLRYKENIKDMADDSSVILNMRPVSFTYKNQQQKRKQYGLIAEEVEQQMPEIVVYDKDTDKPDTIQYQFLPILLLNELKKLETRVRELETQLKEYTE